MTTRSDLALGRLLLERFATLGLDPEWFNQRTPLTYELLELVGGESLVHVEALVEAAEENLSVVEWLGAPRQHHQVLYRFEPAARRAQRGGASLEDHALTLLYVATFRRVNNGRNPVIGERSAERDALTERAAEARDRVARARGLKVGF